MLRKIGNVAIVAMCLLSICSVAYGASNNDIESIDKGTDKGIVSLEAYEPANSFSGGSGTVDDPFLICNEKQFRAIGDFSSKSYKLIANIDLGDKWTTIPEFIGTLDGDGYTIQSSSQNSLIGDNKGIISNCVLADCDNTNEKDKGRLVENNYGRIEKCAIKRNTSYGFAKVNEASGEIVNCYIKNGTSSYYAVIVNKNYGLIENSYAAINNLQILSVNKADVANSSYEGCTIINSYFDKELVGEADSKSEYARSTVAMKNMANYEDWDFYGIWDMNRSINNGYPYLKCEKLDNAITNIEIPTSWIVDIADKDKSITVTIDGDIKYSDIANVAYWETSDSGIVDVVKGGRLIPVKEGKATITFGYDKYTLKCEVEVVDSSKYTSLAELKGKINKLEIDVQSDKDTDAVVFLAIYDKEGSMTEIRKVDTKLKDGNNIVEFDGVAFRYDNSYKAKVFIWYTDNITPLMSETINLEY